MAREMKDSGIEWIGEIPKDWEINTVFQLFTQVKNKNVDMREKNLLSLSYGKIKQKSIDTVGGLLPESFEGYNIVEENDIVLRLTDLQNDQKSLRVGYVEEKGIVTSAYCTIRTRNVNSGKYLYYYLHSFDIAKGFYGMGAGVRQGLNWDGLKWLKIIIPPFGEQKRIVDFLDWSCAELGNVLEKTRASIEEYKKLKQAVITQAVTKGIKGDREKKDSGVEWIGEIPLEWEVCKFGKCVAIKSNLVAPEKYMDYLQIAPDNIEKGSARLLDNIKTVKEVGVISGNHLFHKGQIIYSKIRPMLNKLVIAPFDGLCSADMYPIETENDTEYIVFLMLSDLFLSQVGLVTMNRVKMPKINQSELANIRVPLPKIEEQREIAKYLKDKCIQLDEIIDKKEQYLREIENYKKSLIYEYVTGKKEVPQEY